MEKKIYILIIVLFLSFGLVSAIEEKEICQKVYFMIVNSNWGYNETQINNLNKELNITNASEYVEHYLESCYLKGHSDLLPKLPDGKQINLYKNNTQPCNLNMDGIFGVYVPIPEISLGNAKCSEIKPLKLIFSFSSDGDTYSISGVRYLTAVVMIIVIIVIVFFVKNKKFNKSFQTK